MSNPTPDPTGDEMTDKKSVSEMTLAEARQQAVDMEQRAVDGQERIVELLEALGREGIAGLQIEHWEVANERVRAERDSSLLALEQNKIRFVAAHGSLPEWIVCSGCKRALIVGEVDDDEATR